MNCNRCLNSKNSKKKNKAVKNNCFNQNKCNTNSHEEQKPQMNIDELDMQNKGMNNAADYFSCNKYNPTLPPNSYKPLERLNYRSNYSPYSAAYPLFNNISPIMFKPDFVLPNSNPLNQLAYHNNPQYKTYQPRYYVHSNRGALLLYSIPAYIK